MTIGPTIVRLRQERGMTLRQLCKASGLAYGTVYGVETRQTNCSLQTARLIATALGLRTSELVRLAEENLCQQEPS